MSWVAVVPVKGTPEAKSRLGDLPDRGGLADAFALDTVAALLATPLIGRVFVVTADDAIAARLAELGAMIVPEVRREPAGRGDRGDPAALRAQGDRGGMGDQSDLGGQGDKGDQGDEGGQGGQGDKDGQSDKGGQGDQGGQGGQGDQGGQSGQLYEAIGQGDPLNAAIRQGADAARAACPECGIAVLTGDLPALTVADVEAALGLAAAHPRSMVADEEGTGTTALLALAGVPFSPRFGPGSRAAHESDGHVPLGLPPTATIRRDVDTPGNLAEALHHGVGVHTSALVAGASAADID